MQQKKLEEIQHAESFIPSSETTIPDIEEKKIIYVMFEDGMWPLNDHFKLLDGLFDGEGWVVPIEHKKEVERICKQTDLIYNEVSLKLFNVGSYAELKSQIKLSYFKNKKRDIWTEISKLALALGIKNADMEDVVNHDDIKHEISEKKADNTESGKKLLELIPEYLKWKRKFEYAKKQELISKIALPKKSISDFVDENKYAYLLRPSSEKNLIEELKNVRPNISTGYDIGNIKLDFPGGAISIIAAPTSHGKTSALINFCLGAITKNPEKKIYFLTYEESWGAILYKSLNTYYGKELSKNNKSSIAHYFRTGTTEYITKEKRDDFIEQKEVFFNELINTGRLNVFYQDMPVEEMVEAIRFLKRKTDIGMICIDYVQLLKLKQKNKSSRQEELKEICLMLKDIAIETGIPIVLAAQFNREVQRKEDLSPIKIGEAGDIERVASIIIGMWNHNFDLEKKSEIYFEILKGRDVGNGHNSTMKFDGNTGKITNVPNNPSPFS